jgi:hypothetical protein
VGRFEAVNKIFKTYLPTTIYAKSLVNLCLISKKKILLGVGIQYCDVMSRYPRRWDGCGLPVVARLSLLFDLWSLIDGVALNG